MNYKKFLFNFILAIVLLGANLLLFNFLLSGGFFRWDLTEDKEYTISEATKRIVGSLGDQLTIRGYFSKELPSHMATIPGKIKDICEEYRAYSNGMIKLEFLDPSEDPVAEQQAMEQYGIQEHTLPEKSHTEYSLKKCYFSLLILYGDGFKILPISTLLNLNTLEYELTSAIKYVVFSFQSDEALFAKMQGVIKLKGYISKEKLPEEYKGVPDLLEKVCREYKEKSKGKFEYTIEDPTDNRALQQEASKFGIRSMSPFFPPDQSKAFYLAALIEIGGRHIRLDLNRKDITSKYIGDAIDEGIHRMVPGFLKTVGILVPPPDIPPEMRMRMQQPPQSEFEYLKKILEQEYEVRTVSLKNGEPVPEDIDVLLVARPKEMTEVEKYAIDQYVMKGGPLILCIDAGEMKQRPANPRNPMDRGGAEVVKLKTNLTDLLANWGIRIKPEIVLDTKCLSQTTPVRNPQDPRRIIVKHFEFPYAIQIQKDGFNKNNVIVSGLESLSLLLASPVEVDPGKNEGAKISDLVKSSKESWTTVDFKSVVNTTAEKVMPPPPDQCEPQVLAKAVVGKFKSFFFGKEIPKVVRPAPPGGGNRPPGPIPPGGRIPPRKPPAMPPGEIKKSEKPPQTGANEKKTQEEEGKPAEKKEKKKSPAQQPGPLAALSSGVEPGAGILAVASPAPLLQEEKKGEEKPIEKKQDEKKENEKAPGEEKKEGEKNEEEAKPKEELLPQITLEESPETRIIVVGDADFLSDTFGIRSYQATPNTKFLFNMIDWALLDSDMISIRSRGATSREIEDLSSDSKLLIEILNYVIPIGLVVAFGVIRLLLRKRQTLLVYAPHYSAGPALSPSPSELGESDSQDDDNLPLDYEEDKNE